MSFLKFLESIRTGIGDFFFSTITYVGDEILFLVLAILFFWCINKREGYYILVTGVVGSVINQWLKIICCVPRPWVIDPSLTVVGNAKDAATGFSFPSGHTQNVTGTFGCIGVYNKKKWVKILSVAMILLVSFSRMYLGVHTPYDVGASLLIASGLVFLFYQVFKTEERQKKFMDLVVICSVILSVAFVIFVFTLPEANYTEDHALHSLLSAKKNAATLTGCLIALLVVYPLDKFVIKFETSARWYSQLIKLVIGVGVNLFIKEVMELPLNDLFNNEYIGRIVRYFLIVVFSGAVWPLTFKFFKNLEIPFMERFTDWMKKKWEALSEWTKEKWSRLAKKS